ncbi:hypothetical protein BDY17DRAFT_296690 [Neohortaea acidophila]|uniref:Uncharacterized protein n=1 Tax=Neohortaea acidophila TaxID=245834 RepID=A0A6A6PTP2_9PEZI|nr:uncharacterized protein BDY17DRAFT_296690 [Neohortaea acidophila]KAF2483054.1 hypothetical protein BDY17DRAFT_296690 [Neohortaea acidophila]
MESRELWGAVGHESNHAATFGGLCLDTRHVQFYSSPHSLLHLFRPCDIASSFALAHSLVHFLTCSLPHFFTSSLLHFLTSSLPHFFTSSLLHFFRACDRTPIFLLPLLPSSLFRSSSNNINTSPKQDTMNPLPIQHPFGAPPTDAAKRAFRSAMIDKLCEYVGTDEFVQDVEAKVASRQSEYLTTDLRYEC